MSSDNASDHDPEDIDIDPPGDDDLDDEDEPDEDRQDLWADWRHETDHQFHFNDR